jgi:hypothetical protein
MFPAKFSLAVKGNGELTDVLLERIRERYPLVVIYDRQEEASRSPSDSDLPPIPQVAYVDIQFTRNGRKETATIHCFHQHRFFNYDLDETFSDQRRMDYLLNSMMTALDTLCVLPAVNEPVVVKAPAEAMEAFRKHIEQQAEEDPEADESTTIQTEQESP